MKPLFLTVTSVVVLLLAGCNTETRESPDTSKIKIDAPGVNVDIKKSPETDTKPDVKVDVDTKR